MTCIVALTSEQTLFMAGDSAASTSDIVYCVSNRKVFSVENRFLVGCAGSFRFIDLMQFSLKVGPHPDNLSDDAFMRTVFVEAVRKTIEDGGLPDSVAWKCLVGYAGRIYEVQDDLSVLTISGEFHAIGDGDLSAMGSLYTTREHKDGHFRTTEAVAAAAQFSTSVRGPVVVVEMRRS